ncbi:MAG TPA: UTP--glucose-1-phosphate uridylyltransferase [bacterium]|nr:UTP--glucose-1-phosphate uridylyltransferase [bacterium]HPN32055.1 UTP--glucose-1-phosphate uridylyltransferase [bacterium]
MTELFNEKLFNRLCSDYIAGKLDKKNNILKGNILPPDNITDMYPEKNSEIYNYYKALGESSVTKKEYAAAVMNGGMATRFGSGVKGVAEVYNNKSFLQIKIEFIKKISEQYGVQIPVFIMNSIFTDKITRQHFESNNYFGYDKSNIVFFNQYVFKRLNPDGTVFSDNDNLFYGCGHGDFFYAFNEFAAPNLDKKIKYIFYSNVDNLGAAFDPVILGYHISKNKNVTVEVAKKNKGDRGGAPAIVDGVPQIVEEFKFPASFNQDSIKIFNSASYTFSIGIFRKKIELPFYVVEKKAGDSTVIQFERLAGDITMFEDSNYIEIDRNIRFLPVKTKEDLESVSLTLMNFEKKL